LAKSILPILLPLDGISYNKLIPNHEDINNADDIMPSDGFFKLTAGRSAPIKFLNQYFVMIAGSMDW
jgi:hypothetical protein